MKFQTLILALFLTMASGVAYAWNPAFAEPVIDKTNGQTVQLAHAVGTEYVKERIFSNYSEERSFSSADLLEVFASSSTVQERIFQRDYKVVQYILTNKHDRHIEILQGEVLNAVDMNVAMMQLYQEQSRRQTRGNLVWRAIGAVSSRLPLPIETGIDIAENVADGVSISSNMADSQDLASSMSRYNKTIPRVILSPGESYILRALVPKSDTPRVKLVFKDIKTNDVYDIRQ